MSLKIAELPKIYDAGGSLLRKWFVFYSFRNPESGKMQRFRVYENINSYKTIASRGNCARIVSDQILKKINSGWSPFNDVLYANSSQCVIYNDIRKCNTTWNKVLKEYLEEARPGLRYGTYTTYKSKLNIFCRWLEMKKISDNDISVTDDQVIKDFYSYLFNERKLSNKMVNHYTRLFRKICNDLMKRKIIYKNYFEQIQKYHQITITPQVIPDKLLKDLKEYFLQYDCQMWTVCQFIFYCFIRPIELRYLKVKYIDFVGGWVTIPADIAKNKKTQRVIIPDHFLNYLVENNYHTADREYFVFSLRGTPGENTVSKNYMFRHFDLARIALNIPKDYKFYSLKHSGGLKLYKSGADPIEMKNQFRHHSLDQLMQYLKALEGAESEHIRYNGFKL
jgi:integrase